jgi:hypothetical protein
MISVLWYMQYYDILFLGYDRFHMSAVLERRAAALNLFAVLLLAPHQLVISPGIASSARVSDRAANGAGNDPATTTCIPSERGQNPPGSFAVIRGQNIRLEFDTESHSRILVNLPDGTHAATGPFSASEILLGAHATWKDFRVIDRRCEDINDALGRAKKLLLTGKSGPLIKTVAVTIYDEISNLAALDVEYTNTGPSIVPISGWVNNRYTPYGRFFTPCPAVLVVSERILRETSLLGASAEARI